MKNCLKFAFGTFALVMVAVGCGSGPDMGETVPSPPRELVEKTFKQPPGNSNAGQPAGKP
ncbi:MAG: hypothetical protein BGO01_10640 [Armatimonadetes bacterium 55-13]|nr:MAG: hypothetical protein BGO01_10640 [Armatimonadetes bacterium 55-13]